jgi:exopolysaccharide production protein ExoQ
MLPLLMTFVYVVAIVGLYALNRDKEPRPSKALWIPVAWLFINCSRPVSLWLGVFGLRSPFPVADPTQIYLDGSPIDGAAFAFLLVAGFIVIAHRSQRVLPLLPRMLPILIYFLYCALSVLWSEYPFVAFKHWNKGIGDIVMVLVILTDPEPSVAFKRVLSRISIVLLPLSILFIKYYPSLGRAFTISGFPMYTGVTMQKNTLGVICLIFGLGSLWRILALYRDREVPRRTQQLIAQGAILMMTAWLLWMCDSMTSITCFIMGGGLMLVAYRPKVARNLVLVHLLVAAILGFSLFAVFFDSSGDLVQGLGRNPTLTGRTAIWEAVLPLAGDPLIGAGYESFWLGPRLEKFWSMNDGAYNGIQEAHNGYLELYLNLGWIGVVLLGGLVILSYPRVIATYRDHPDAGSLGLAFFVAEVVYNFTEAGFRMMFPLWIFFLLAVLGIPAAPDPQSLSAIGADLTEDVIGPEADVDHAIGVGLRESMN